MANNAKEDIGVFVSHITDMQRSLFAYILTLVPSLEDANEVLQQANLVLWSKREEFAPGSNFQAWACRIAYYEVLARRQRWRRDRLQFDHDLMEKMAGEATPVATDSTTELRALARCREELSPADRELLDLRYQESLKTLQIAEKVGRSAVAIRKALFRIRALLSKCIEGKLKMEERS
jgi:RNA polymerase sigma-70 factor (ECF subfamily)